MAPSGLKPHNGRYLTFAEREEIAICRVYGFLIREIARHLGRSASTISRELRRNAATRGGTLHYRAVAAQWKAERQTCRPKVGKLAANDRLRHDVQERLSGAVTALDGTPILGPEVRWIGRRHGRRQGRRGRSHGVRSRLPTGSGSTSLMMSRCGSRTRRSTRPFYVQAWPSTPDHARHSIGGRQPKHLMTIYYCSNQAVLRRPLEPEQYTAIRFTAHLDVEQIAPSIV
jgi:hypothetical protein